MNEKYITLDGLCTVENILSRSIRVAFFDDKHNIDKVIECRAFRDIKNEVSDPWKYRVVRIDSLGDIICVYVEEEKDV